MIVVTEHRKGALWKRTALYADNVVYVPIGIFANPEKILMMAGWEGVKMIVYKKKLFIDADWMANEFADDGNVVAFIARAKKGVLSQVEGMAA